MVIKKSLYQISQQNPTINQKTLYRCAEKLFGRSSGEFTKEEEDKLLHYTNDILLSSTTIQDNKENDTIQNNGKDEATLTLDTLSLPSLSYSLPKELVLQFDLMIQSKIPQWRHLPDHTKILAKFLTRNLEKAMALIAEERKMAVELAKEYNQWIDEQLENDYLDGFKKRVQKDWKSL